MAHQEHQARRGTTEPRPLGPARPGALTTVGAALEPDFVALRPDQFSFDDPDDWIVRDFRIGGRSQMRPELRGDDVRPADFAAALRERGCDTIQTRMMFEMDVIYRGTRAEQKFCCRLSGPCV